MAVEVVMPKFGLTMTEGTIQQWFKSEGDAIKTGESLFEVETEKVLYEVEASADGTVAKLLYAVEAVVGVGLPVAIIAEAGEEVAEVAARYADAPAAAPAAAPPEPAPVATSAPSPAPQEKRGRVPVTPAARKLAKEHSIDLSGVAGTGPRGRITREDVQKTIDSGGQAAPPPAPTATPAAAEDIPLRGMRKVIAERMHQSLQGSAQLTISTEADVTQLIDRRQEVRQEFNVTYTDFIVQACAHALRQHPRMNAHLEGDIIRANNDIHVGLAVALDEGLIVPVVRDADKKSLKDIAAEAKTLAEKARASQLKLEEVSGGTFTVSNLGMYGVDAFTPIINAPQSGILGVGRIVEKPVIHRGEVTRRSMMVLSLTFDHRVIDGAPAGAFLQTVADLLAHGNRVSLDTR
ncbi:MAG: dihydrolipoamide acetyltransferase family protein [Desulfurellaceae bacterium]|nr:dihydrolipoamide acetyltransferase family protein [Desulfurellaceae bacterium]